MFGYLIVKFVPNIFVQKLKVHCAFLVRLTAEEAPEKPFSPFLTVMVAAESRNMVVVSACDIAECLADIFKLLYIIPL